jgi:predicted ATP-grasp superfamily ATP-dependent carboligase
VWGNFLETLDVMLLGIKIDPEPFYKMAEKIKRNIRKFME